MKGAERLSQDPTFWLIGSEKICGAWDGADFSVAIIRDGVANPRLTNPQQRLVKTGGRLVLPCRNYGIIGCSGGEPSRLQEL